MRWLYLAVFRFSQRPARWPWLPLLLLTLAALSEPARAQQRLRYRDWQLVWLEDFDTYRDVADMQARSPWKFTPDTYRTLVNNAGEDEYYDPHAAELHEGTLHLIARPLPEPLLYRYSYGGRDTVKVLHFESGWLSLKSDYQPRREWGDTARWPGNRGVQYGLFEIRCRLGAGAGTWPAFWLFNGPTEIDVLESLDHRSFSNNLHWNPSNGPARSRQAEFQARGGADLAAAFHTYTVSWTAQAVSFYLDGRLLRTIPATELPTFPAPADIIVNQAVLAGAPATTWAGPPDQRHSTLIVDYIKVYKPRPGR
ncbi:glycoside hydrolase family 16 protein [Hymenobacter sp. NST-14]|uniref:glycoside hydrolase family 16 protein n=1 Tax=Hymenobacter piscis TaxID=2839984 RepID=UPI001C03149B|nr:glycoside hydrolase family 16 protein [Hymenobacter piscis]MBT9393436.1 glycoside hydrolase family 16 protein [Hymenobacter piscis]